MRNRLQGPQFLTVKLKEKKTYIIEITPSQKKKKKSLLVEPISQHSTTRMVNENKRVLEWNIKQ